jgi:hypothetical protein
MTETLRNAGLDALHGTLVAQHARKVDVVAPISKVSFDGGQMVISGVEPSLTDDGVVMVDGAYQLTGVAEEDFCTRFGIPVRYYRQLVSNGLVGLVDENANGMINHATETAIGNAKPTPQLFLRTYRADGDQPGVIRSALSDKFKAIDNLDVLVAALQGVCEADPDAQIVSCDLSETRMYVRMVSGKVSELAPELLRGYRSPFDADPNITRPGGGQVERWRAVANREGLAYQPGTEPVVHAGFDISNSEVGRGAFSITPVIMVQICKNGLRVPLDALRARHVGARQTESVVEASTTTQDKELALITSQATDAVKTFLSPEYLRSKLEEIRVDAGVPVTRPDEVVRRTAKALRFDDVTREGVLQHFLTAGQCTAGGVMQAVTSYAQTRENADAARELEDSALKVLVEAAHAARALA